MGTNQATGRGDRSGSVRRRLAVLGAVAVFLTGCSQGPSWDEYNACQQSIEGSGQLIAQMRYETCHHLRPSAP